MKAYQRIERRTERTRRHPVVLMNDILIKLVNFKDKEGETEQDCHSKPGLQIFFVAAMHRLNSKYACQAAYKQYKCGRRRHRQAKQLTG
ncbi:hypothetical protein D3C74_295290 [compost metagenome]